MILDTKDFINQINEELKNIVSKINKNIKLSLIRIGDNKGAISFEKSIKIEAGKIGLEVISKVFDSKTSEEEVLSYINKNNDDESIQGILVFVPIEADLDQKKILNTISIYKDVDGLNEFSKLKLFSPNDYINTPTTALSTFEYLKSLANLEGKDVLIINRSEVIGKPLALMLINEGATVQIAHSKTVNLYEKISKSDIVISGIGKAKIIDTNQYKENAIVIDLGYDVIDNKIYGDFNSEKYEQINIRFLPSIGGIGRINSNMIIRNAIRNGERNGK
ncbi:MULTISPECIES: tetrahydrofolate dehydrogenase/cyclohydrolase catalytic domain-containing protein [Helcococcus]|uniref:Bifunctional 5,10-methylenetetrahydrofolate dehydrogenase/5,10-methenyltetrahydrofolate cyclohydrolase n=1 Tax=Helcococcus bovis TaxID=3153252 RepID=A0ABW9F999_9FIRM